MARAANSKKQTRIQREKKEAILEAALNVFSSNGFRGATVDQIAKAAGLSKPNLLYYFSNKEAIHRELLARLLDTWLDPLRHLDAQGDPLGEINRYVTRKVEMSRDMPRESRLFANEVMQGASRIDVLMTGEMKALVDTKAAVLSGWMEAGKIARLDPYHLIFSIWATTQHYADFEVQVRGILGAKDDGHFEDASAFLTELYTRALSV